VWNQGSAEKDTGGNGRNANQVVLKQHANKGRNAKQVMLKQQSNKRRNAKQVVLNQHAKQRAICKTDGCKWKPDFGACKEAARRRRKENGNSKKTDQELEQDINSKGPTVKELIPETGSAQPSPSPTPAGQPHLAPR
jgi:hypothetical protein